MYCNHCGVQLPAGAVNCPSCRQGVPNVRPARVARNITLLSALWYAMGALRIIAAIAISFMAAIVQAFVSRGEVPFPVHVVVIGVAILIALFAIASLAVGWGLHHRAPWGRTLGIVMAFVSLLSVPFGTALGIYTLAILLPGEAEDEYAALINSPR